MNRPIAVTGLAFISAILGVFFLIIALGAIQIVESGQSLGGIGLLFALLGVLLLGLGFGLFTLKSWAWPLGIGVAVGTIVLAVLSAFSRATLAGIVIAVMPAIFLIGGLYLPDVRKAFKR